MQTGDVAREKVFNMRMSIEEWKRLEEVAADLGVNAANAIRILVKRHYDGILQDAFRNRAAMEKSMRDLRESKPEPKKSRAKR